MTTVFIRTFIMFAVIFGALRLMGKRQVGELEINELVITFMLSELAVVPITDSGIPLLYSIVPTFVLMSVELILSLIISKSSFFKKILLGKPSVIIQKGKLDQCELKKLRMSVSELMSELRLKGIASIDEVEYAIIEDNGQLSVFTKESVSENSPKNLPNDQNSAGIAHCIIIEGKIYEENLKLAGKSREWVFETTRCLGKHANDIFLMTVDDAGKIYIIDKERNQ